MARFDAIAIRFRSRQIELVLAGRQHKIRHNQRSKSETVSSQRFEFRAVRPRRPHGLPSRKNAFPDRPPSPNDCAISPLRLACVRHDRRAVRFRYQRSNARLGDRQSEVLRRDPQRLRRIGDLKSTARAPPCVSRRKRLIPSSGETKRAVAQPIDLRRSIAELQVDRIPSREKLTTVAARAVQAHGNSVPRMTRSVAHSNSHQFPSGSAPVTRASRRPRTRSLPIARRRPADRFPARSRSRSRE